MVTYADPELLLSALLHEVTGHKAWADPILPDNWPFTAPLYHVQRGQGEGDLALSLDSVLLDLDTYAKNADHAREAAQQAWAWVRFELPHYTWPSGITVSGTATVTPPFWAPATGVYRRSATYRVILHGVIS
jgi:hypothetical protein